MNTELYTLKTRKVLLTLFEILFGVTFLFLLFIIVFHNQNIYYPFLAQNLLYTSLFFVCFLLLLYVLYQTFLINIVTKFEPYVVSFLFLSFFLVQLLAAQKLAVAPTGTWDYGIVFSSAEKYVLNGTLPDEYFLLFPNNTPLYLVLVNFFKILSAFGIKDFLFPSILLNIFCIDLSLLFLYYTAKTNWGAVQASFTLLIGFITPAFLLYTPILYTDTITLPFVSAIVFLWVRIRNHLKNGEMKKAYISLSILLLLSILGCTLKFSVIILPIAVLIDYLLLKFKKKYVIFILSLLIFYSGYQLLNYQTKHTTALPKYDYDQSIPYTHWVMMGLNGYGDYNNDDYQLTLSYNDIESRKAFNLKEINSRLEEMGMSGLWEHLVEKTSFTWGEGTYTATEKLNRSALNASRWHYYVLHTEPGYPIFAVITFAILFSTLFFMLVSCIFAIYTKSFQTTFLRIAIFGLFLFLLVWETRARYLINFLPIMLLSASDGLHQISQFWQNRKNSRNKQ